MSSTSMINKQKVIAVPADPTASSIDGFCPSSLIGEGRMVITPQIAEQILSTFNYQNQRRVEITHVAKLASEMANDHWTAGSQIAFGVMPNKKLHLVNGQHRLHAVIKSDKANEFQILLIDVADESDLKSAYYRFDTVQRSRSDAAILDCLGTAKEYRIGKTIAVQAYRAGIILNNGLRVVHYDNMDPIFGTPDGKLDAIQEWWEYVREFNDLIVDAPLKIKRRMMNPSIMAVALVTLRFQPAKAKEFWSGISSDNGLVKGDPRKALLRTLTLGATKESPGAFLIHASHCWDAWFLGKKLDHSKVHDNSICAPLGTPFSKLKSERAAP